MSAFGSAWALLKLLPSEEKKFGQGYGDFSDFDEKRVDRYGTQVDPDGIDGPTTQEEMDEYRRVMDAPPPRRTPQMDDDPFRMKKPDMSGQIGQILTEIQRRKERKAMKNLFNEDGTGKPEFDKYGVMDRTRELGEFDRVDPQDNQLISSTRPEMDSRMEALRAEMARRAGRKEAKRQDEEDPDWPYSVKTFDEENLA